MKLPLFMRRITLPIISCALLASCGGGKDAITLSGAVPEEKAETPETLQNPEAKAKRPNIVLVVSDDQRWDLMSARNHSFVKTPNLDAIAQSGAMMENAFVPVALCSPSRGALLTGRDVHKASAPRIVWINNSFLQTQRTFAEDMQDAGYTTAYVGKWHLGKGSEPKRGFDHWESFDWLGDFYDPTIWQNGEKRTYTGFVDDVLADRASEIISASENVDKPLFLVVGLKEPHLQFEHAERFKKELVNVNIPQPDSYNEDFSESGKLQEIKDWLGMDNFHCGLNCFGDSWDTYIKSHYRAVMGLDAAVGEIRNSINASTAADNTLFIYTSDNGYSLGDHGLTEKHFVYEEPIRVPLLIDAPGSDDAGKSVSEMISTIDIAPTILDYADVEIPATMTGRSVRTLLEPAAVSDQSEVKPWRDQLFFMYEKAQIAVRTEQFKLIKSLTVEGHYELYDLVNDSKEIRTVYADSAYNEPRREMRRRLKEIVEQNQWSQRKSYPVQEILVSNPIPSDEAAAAALALSTRDIRTDPLLHGSKTVGSETPLSWTQLSVGTEKFEDRFPLKMDPLANDGQSVLVYLPLHLVVDWDPFTEIKIRRRTHAWMYHAGEQLFTTTEKRKPLEVANPALFNGDNFVILRFDDTGAMDAKLEIESTTDTLVLPLENDRLLGTAPGRFTAIDSWQPHNEASLSKVDGALQITATGKDFQMQSENLYLDEPVDIKVTYSTGQSTNASLYWRSQYEGFSEVQRAEVSFSAGSQQQALIAIDDVSEIDVLRLDLEAAEARVLIDSIEITSRQGNLLHQWGFDTDS